MKKAPGKSQVPRAQQNPLFSNHGAKQDGSQDEDNPAAKTGRKLGISNQSHPVGGPQYGKVS